MSTPLILVSLLLVVLSTISLLMPWFARPEIFFGVTVPADFRHSPAARGIAQLYRAGVGGVAVVSVAIVLAAQRPAIGLFAHVLGTCAMLILAHQAASKHASPRASVVEVDVTARPERMPGGALAPLLPLLWLLGLGVWAALNAARLPGRIILHYGLHGADRFVATPPLVALTVVGFPGLACLVLAAAAYGMLHWSRRIATAGPAAAGERTFRRLTVLLVLAVEYLLSMLPLLLLLGVQGVWMWIWVVALWITLIVFVIRLARVGQGGTRLAAAAPGALPVGDRTDDAYWHGGMIYFNRADPALFVEKRMGIGWTLNFGHFLAWVFIAVTIAIPLSLGIARARLNTPETRAQAQTAALTWLNSVDTRKYTASWDTANSRFREAVPEEQWVSRISALRGRLGPVESRRVSSLRVVGLLGTVNDERVVIQFKTSFEHNPDAVETVTPMKDSDGQWRVSGYYIK
jgi:uncharacterized membrane protein